MFRALIETNDDRIAMLARLVLGIVVVPHGAQTLLGWFGGSAIPGALGFYAGSGVAPFLGWLGTSVEFFAGVALLFGLVGRIAALAIAADLLAAAVSNWDVGFFMNWNGTLQGEGFEFHILAITLALIVVICGSGALSLDRALLQRSLAADDPAA
jgi:putative oxidoreductase